MEKGGSFVEMKGEENISDKDWESVKIKATIAKKARDFKAETGLPMSYIVGKALDNFINNFRKGKLKP